MPSTLTTERLILQPLTAADADDLYDAFRRPEAMRFMDDHLHTSAAETRKMVDGMLSGPGTIWTIRTAADGPALGFVEYIGNAGVPGMGYMLHPDHWGNGYMTEAVRAALVYGFDEMGLDRVELWISQENTASLRLAERAGFRRRGRMRQKYHKDESGHDKIVYGITAEQWRTGQLAGNAQAAYSLAPILAVPDVLGGSRVLLRQAGLHDRFSIRRSAYTRRNSPWGMDERRCAHSALFNGPPAAAEAAGWVLCLYGGGRGRPI